jgi:hypothetical protein
MVIDKHEFSVAIGQVFTNPYTIRLMCYKGMKLNDSKFKKFVKNPYIDFHFEGIEEDDID